MTSAYSAYLKATNYNSKKELLDIIDNSILSSANKGQFACRVNIEKGNSDVIKSILDEIKNLGYNVNLARRTKLTSDETTYMLDINWKDLGDD